MGLVERMAAAAYHAFSDTDPTSEWAWWYGKDEGVPYDWRKEADHTSVGHEGFLKCARAALSELKDPPPVVLALIAAHYKVLPRSDVPPVTALWNDIVAEFLK